MLSLSFTALLPYDFTNPSHPATLRSSAQRAARPYDPPGLHFALSLHPISTLYQGHQRLDTFLEGALLGGEDTRRGQGDCLSTFSSGAP